MENNNRNDLLERIAVSLETIALANITQATGEAVRDVHDLANLNLPGGLSVGDEIDGHWQASKVSVEETKNPLINLQEVGKILALGYAATDNEQKDWAFRQIASICGILTIPTEDEFEDQKDAALAMKRIDS